MTDIASAILTVALLCWCMAMRPTRMHAPPGWYVNGVQPSGTFEVRLVVGAPQDDISDSKLRRWIEDRYMRGRIYCTGGATPRQDGSSVWCQR